MEATYPTRLVICVDGTWFTADGPRTLYTNISNIYRICASIKLGECVLNNGKRIIQCIFLALGQMLPLIHLRDIYEICCKLPPHEGNEIWLYGFSRGAYVVRAVAGLLHHIRALTSAGTSTFPGDYEEALQLYSEDKQGLLSLGQRQSFLATNTRQAPAINFLGAFDTVKRVSSGQHLYDISLNESILHLRHALAVNKDWIALEPEYLFPDISTRNSFKKRTFVKHGV